MGDNINMVEVTRLEYFLATSDVSKYTKEEHLHNTEWYYLGKCMAQMIVSVDKRAFWIDKSLYKER